MKKAVLVALVGVLAGCAGSQNVFDAKYTSQDSPREGGIVVSFKNETGRMVCLNPEDWPGAGGKLDQAADSVYLIVEGRKFPIKDFNTGYCVGGCPTYVAPGQSISANLKYDEFLLPPELRDAPKELHFSPKAFFCKKK